MAKTDNNRNGCNEINPIKAPVPLNDSLKEDQDNSAEIGSSSQNNSKVEELDTQQIKTYGDLTERQKLVKDAGKGDFKDIVPIVAIPYSTPVHSIALSKGPKWLFTGGEDGLIRKFDFFGSVEGKSPLTVAQRHQLVDSISFGGMNESYWENEQPYYKEALLTEIMEEPVKGKGRNKKIDVSTITAYEPRLSPVYSMAVQSDAFWLLSGLKSGGITLQTTRSNEGCVQYYFKDGKDKFQHSTAVSCLKLNNDETKFLSGSWDKKILRWDLNMGVATEIFDKSTGQVSSLDCRPVGGINLQLANSSEKNNDDNNNDSNDEDEDVDALFDESQGIEKNGRDSDNESEKRESAESVGNKQDDTNDQIKKDFSRQSKNTLHSGLYESIVRSDDVFITSSINGIVDVWDSRVSNGSNNVARIGLQKETTPWCMSAIWSSDGNSIYIGRRNSTVEEFDIRNLNSYKNILRFPLASGPVSCVRAFPNRNYLLCGCQDNIRLYDLRLSDYNKDDANRIHLHGTEHHHHHKRRRKRVPFMIVPGHNGGVLSDMYVDPTSRFIVSASGNRGWQGKAADYVFIYEIQKA